jgi:PTS system ascorbate-specific IIA component
MAALLLIAHAPLASALAQVAAHTFPDCAARLRVIDVPSTASLDATEQVLRDALAKAGAAEVLVLADVFGATPCNAALRAADGVHVRVVAGVNVPMLWRTLCYAEEPLDRLVNRAVDGAVQGAMQVSQPRRLNQAPTSLPNAQDPHHDQ